MLIYAYLFSFFLVLLCFFLQICSSIHHHKHLHISDHCHWYLCCSFLSIYRLSQSTYMLSPKNAAPFVWLLWRSCRFDLLAFYTFHICIDQAATRSLRPCVSQSMLIYGKETAKYVVASKTALLLSPAISTLVTFQRKCPGVISKFLLILLKG